MNYSHMDALLASDSKREFDREAMSPVAPEGRSETHILDAFVQRQSGRLRGANERLQPGVVPRD
jgi:hypothetical protein